MRQLYAKGVVCRLMDASELADDDLVAVVSNMGAPLVGQERLTDPKTMALAVTDDGGVPRPEVPRRDVARDRRRQLHPALHGRGHAGPARRRRRLHGARVPRGADDELRHPRSADVPADPGRRPRQRGGGGARGELEVDGAASAARPAWRSAPSPPRARPRARARRSRSARSSAPPPRPSAIGRAVQAARRAHRDPIDAVLEVAGGHQDLRRQDPRHRAARHRGLPARHRDDRGPRRLSAAIPSRSRSRTSSRWAGSTASRGS